MLFRSGLRFTVDVAHGHKTGFYLDQRDNRALVRQAADVDDVLDCFCYSGGFTASALAGGARHVTAVDSSADALALARENVGLNGLAVERVDFIEADVFKHLRLLRDQGRKYDLIVLDPPKFAPTASFAERAARGYKDINLLAFKLLKPGGLLVAQKGPISEEELHAGRRAAGEVGGRVTEVDAFTLPVLGDARTLVVIEKVGPTPKKYPRREGVPNQQPLFWTAR